MPTPISMFDWPEQSHTSPNMTLPNVASFSPLTLSVYGPPARNGPIVVRHVPFWSAVALEVLLLIVTVTVARGVVQPNTGSFISRWRTMLSENMGDTNGGFVCPSRRRSIAGEYVTCSQGRDGTSRSPGRFALSFPPQHRSRQ